MNKSKDFKIWIDEKNKIVNFEMGESVEKVDEELANIIYNDGVEFLNSRPEKKLNILVNVKKSVPENSRVRKILAKTLALPKMKKVAFCSQSTVQRVIVNFVAKASGRTNTNQFATEEEAIEWLKS